MKLQTMIKINNDGIAPWVPVYYVIEYQVILPDPQATVNK